LGKQKATNVIRQVLGFNNQKDSVDGLKSRKFSLIIDETTDHSCKNPLAVLVTYFNPDTFKMDCDLTDIVQLDDGKADTIFKAIVECFEQKGGIPMENIIGFCADTCNVMFGIHHSVAQMLVANYPWIIPIKCSCHMIHLCASHASLQLLRRCVSKYSFIFSLISTTNKEFSGISRVL
jgi:hypothetical protein